MRPNVAANSRLLSAIPYLTFWGVSPTQDETIRLVWKDLIINEMNELMVAISAPSDIGNR